MNKQKFVALSLSAVMLAGSIPMPVMAASIGSVTDDANTSSATTADTVVGVDDAQSKKTEYGKATVDYDASSSQLDVYASLDTTADVLLPKTIILDGAPAVENIGKYVVGARGDISGVDVINIVPEDTVELSTAGRLLTKVADIEQEKQQFTYDDGVNPDTFTTSVGTISAKALMAGKWNGQFHFNLQMEDLGNLSEGEESQYGTKIKSWDVSEAQDGSVMMTYYDPSQLVTVPETKASVNPLFSMLNLFGPITAYAAEPTLTDVECYEDGTIVLTGSGEMADNLYGNLFDIKKYADEVKERIENIWYSKNANAEKLVYEYDTSSIFAFEDSFKIFTESGQEVHGSDYTDNINCYYDMDPDELQEFLKFKPNKIVTKSDVTNISDYAFMFCSSIKEVEFSDNITSLGEGCFAFTSLESVKLPKNLKVINSAAFYHVPISEFNIPEGVTTIGHDALKSTVDFKAIIPSTFTTFISDDHNGIFGQIETGGPSVDVVFREGIKEIPEGCCYAAETLSSVVIPKSVTRIGARAFSHCKNLSTVYLSNNIDYIGEDAFYHTVSPYFGGNDLTIYCQSEAVASLLTTETCYGDVSVIVDSSKF